mgnify:CR=1 FL=1
MKQLVTLTFCASLLAPAATMAQETNPPETGPIERGLRLLLEGMAQDMGPALEGLQELGPDLRQFMMDMGPSLQGLMNDVQDWSLYDVPEILPNGDIIIRRKPKEIHAPKEEDQIDI